MTPSTVLLASSSPLRGLRLAGAGGHGLRRTGHLFEHVHPTGARKQGALTFNPLDVTEMAARIEEALRHEALREEMRQKGLQQAAKFPWERTAQETFQVYQCTATRDESVVVLSV